jgi:acetyl esterase/lipase
MSWLFLLVCLFGAALTYNVYRPTYAPARRAALSFFIGWLTIELALHHIAFQLLATVAFIWAGALEAWPGKLALAIAVVSWAALGWRYWASRESEEIVERALQDGLGADYRSKILPEVSAQFGGGVAWNEILFPFPIRHREVERIRNIRYARVAGLNLKLDVYRHCSRPTDCPTLLQIHGGAWVLGSKNEQGLPLMYHLASRGWVCVSADYRLSPHATFPDHVVDLKRAIGWIREHGREYGANPDFLIVTGGSAGGHLAALVSLTANDPAFQPGFEPVDTSVQGCVPFYGVYDFTDRHGIWHHPGLRDLLEHQIMKASLDEAPELYEQASPFAQITPDDPPFFVIHGALDTMVPVAEARAFCQKFRQTVNAPIVYAEIPHAQHAFEIFPSLRTTFVVQGVERFVSYLYSEYLRSNRTIGDDRTPATATG